MKLHALVSELAVARMAIEGGATVIQLRIKDVSTDELVEQGRPVRELSRQAGVLFVVNDDVAAAEQLDADGVHLGRRDSGVERASKAGLLLGLSAASLEEATAAERAGAAYIGAGPVWETPSKLDADPPIGLHGLAEICGHVSIPVVAIGGIDPSNVSECFAAGARGVAVIRAAAESRALRDAIDRASL